MSRSQNIFHLVLILAFAQILDASPKKPDGFLVKTKSGKTYLQASKKDNEESLEILNRNYGYQTTTTWKTPTTTWTTPTTTHKWNDRPKWKDHSYEDPPTDELIEE